MDLIEVKKKEDWRLFHLVPQQIYKRKKNYIKPLESDIESVFNKDKNKAFQNGQAACFVLLDASGIPIGRIAAFIDHERNRSSDYPVGGIGFFECINDLEAAKSLFNQAETFLSKWSVKAIDGPINFGERDKFCGLLVKGHQEAPIYLENYHPDYYQDIFESLGYLPYEQILTFHGIMDQVPIQRFSQIAERVRKRYGFYTRAMESTKNFKVFAQDFAAVYNEAFKDNPYFKPLEAAVVNKIFKTMRPIIDLKMIFITYEKDKPIAFAGFIPDINPFLKPFKGKLKWYQLPSFILRLRKSKNRRLLKGIAFGIDPAYQKKGAFAELIHSIYNEHTQSQYSDFYLTTIRGHNTLMVKSISNLGVKIERVHLAYRKMLDSNIAFEPYEFIPLDTLQLESV